MKNEEFAWRGYLGRILCILLLLCSCHKSTTAPANQHKNEQLSHSKVSVDSAKFSPNKDTLDYDVQGTYGRIHNSDDRSGYVLIQPLEVNQYWVEIGACDKAAFDYHCGSAWGVVQIHDSVAVLRSLDTEVYPNCYYTLKFLPGHRVNVTNEGCYSFGDVSPDGIYKRESRKKPKLNNFDVYKKPSAN